MRRMKKAAVGVLAAAVALSIGVTSAFAACPGHGRNFSDLDGDGVCDHAGSGCRYTDADRDGICDNRGVCRRSDGSQEGCGRNFVDADGDGVCDNYAAGQAGQGRGCRGGHGR